jgi:glycosyltransferase involved in cell wall biosynthesis
MILSIVVPCYNEEEVLTETSRRLGELLDKLLESNKISLGSKVYYVDDGSRDNTWSLIQNLAANDSRFGGIKLSRNVGHQNALIAGLFTVPGDAVVSIDADLQDDVNVIETMVDSYVAGMDVVSGVRRSRSTDTWFKRFTALAFYRIMKLLGVETIYNHADYRLLSRRAVEALMKFRESNLYLRGIIPLIGFRSGIVYYDRASRFAGQSKYPLTKMIALAANGITSFSIAPLRLITLLGFLVFSGSLAVSAWTLWSRFISNEAIPGWTSVVLPMYLLGGLQMLSVGVLGEYLGRTYKEAKARPLYIIEHTLGMDS